MKRILFSGIALLMVGAAYSQNPQSVGLPVVELKSANQKPAAEVLIVKEPNHDFGKIPQGKPVYYFFDVVNTGDQPLKLDNVQASCGCTTPEWNREAIAPGATDKIKVGYNAATEGLFEKSITITYNGNQTKQLTIKGMVWKAPVGSAPANQSVQFLKQQMQ